MGTTRYTVVLSPKEQNDMLGSLRSKSPSAKPKTTSAFRPVGRIAYEKRKYKEASNSPCTGDTEFL